VGLLVAYAGTAEFAVPALNALAGSAHRVALVITQPDRPAGRGRRPTPSPVKHCALALGLPLLEPERLDAQVAAALAAPSPDALVVAAYGLLIPEPLLALPRLGGINLHASLLPRWRGAAPVQRAIEAGDPVTGVAIMRMEATLDTGPLYRQEQVDIADSDTSATLGARLADRGARLLVSVLDDLERGIARLTPQSAVGASYAAKLRKSEAAIDWRDPALRIARRVRAFDPWPVASTTLDGVPLRVWAARPDRQSTSATPGEILAAGGEGIAVATGDGRLWLTRVQPPGRRPVAAAEYVNAVGRDSLLGRVLGK
jgi:methionyl-tRNA formyltransferase